MLLRTLLVFVSVAVSALCAEVTPTQLLVVEPMPLPTLGYAGDAKATEPAFASELDARALWPEDGAHCVLVPGATSAFAKVATDAGRIAWAGATNSVGFVAVYLHVDRYGPVKIAVEGAGDIRLCVDGKEVAHQGSPAATSTIASVDSALATGLHRVLARIESNTAGTVRVVADGRASQSVAFAIEPQHAPASYDALRTLVGISGLALSPDGELLAYRDTRRDLEGEGSQTLLHVAEVKSHRIVAAALLGSGASVVAWSRDGQQLLVRKGTSLFTWSRVNGAVQEVLHDEPGLGAVSWSDDASFLVFASTRGAPANADTSNGAKRRTQLREKLSDWPVEPHLHMLVLESGARRRLVSTGDWTCDAFAIGPHGVNLVYVRSLPQDTRPWFKSEIRERRIASGEDRLVATLVMGFENRAALTSFALSDDGRRVAFTGPPAILGAGVEPNAFDPDLWVVDLADGHPTKVTADFAPSVEGHLAWLADGKLSFVGTDGSLQRVFVAEEDGAAWSIEAREAPREVETITDASLAHDGSRVAIVGSATDRLPALFIDESPWFEPNMGAQRRWLLAAPVDATFTNSAGTKIEAWLYRPAPSPVRPTGKLPLVVYYYGGATPTLRGFNDLHQFLTSNGYAVLVVNPRGCAGYGEAFANEHTNDWGTKAGADILEALAQTLRQHSDLDGSKVGCYGGSYGGFMTMWLVSHSQAFAAAVSMYGISNLASYYGEGTWGYTYGDQAMAANAPWRQPSWWTEHSPVFAADKITAPLLLLHGEADTNVPIGESEQMFTALKLLNKPVEFVRFPGEDHGLRGTWANRALHRTMLLEWFDKWLKGQPSAWDARW